MNLLDRMSQHLGATSPLRYIKSAFWLTSSKAASMGISLITTFYIARSLGPQNFGELSYAQSVLGILAIFGALTSVLYRDLINQKNKESVLLGTAWIISISASFIVILSVSLYVFIFPHDQLTILVLGILCLTQFVSPFFIIQNVFYAKTETKWLSIATLINHIVISAAKISAMALGQGVLVLAVIMLLEQLLMAAFLFFLYTRLHQGRIFQWSFSSSYAKKLIMDSLPMVAVTVSSMTAARIDQVFLKYYGDMTAVGHYGVAVQLSEMWQFLPAIILAAVFPAMVNAKHNLASYRKRLWYMFGSMLIFGLTASLLTTLLAPYVVPIIYGEAFLPSITVLQIYCWSIAGMILSFGINHFLITENMRRAQILSSLAPAILNILLNLYLIPIYGSIGAALATAISYSLLPFIPLYYSNIRSILFGTQKLKPHDYA